MFSCKQYLSGIKFVRSIYEHLISILWTSSNKIRHKFQQSFEVRALYDFRQQEAGELEFNRDDVVTVTEWSDKNWWRGQVTRSDGNVESGIFPSNHVQVPPNIAEKLSY